MRLIVVEIIFKQIVLVLILIFLDYGSIF
jgi:hypothetical protein